MANPICTALPAPDDELLLRVHMSGPSPADDWEFSQRDDLNTVFACPTQTAFFFRSDASRRQETLRDEALTVSLIVALKAAATQGVKSTLTEPGGCIRSWDPSLTGVAGLIVVLLDDDPLACRTGGVSPELELDCLSRREG